MPGQPSWQRKFNRAEGHLLQLATLVSEFLATHPYTAVEEVEAHPDGPDSTVHSWRGRIQDKPPREWSPIIGDCLNNLRSSLDHIAWALAEVDGDRFTSFPIFSDEAEYRRVTPGRHLKQVRPDAHDVIYTFQPFHHIKGPDAHFLALLDRLTNSDKHRELLGTEVGVAHIQVESPIGPTAAGDTLTFEFEPQQGWFEDQKVFTRYRSSNPDVYVPLIFSFDVAFDPACPAHGQPAVTCLASLMVAVYMVLLALEVRFFAADIPELIKPPLDGVAEFVGPD